MEDIEFVSHPAILPPNRLSLPRKMIRTPPNLPAAILKRFSTLHSQPRPGGCLLSEIGFLALHLFPFGLQAGNFDPHLGPFQESIPDVDICQLWRIKRDRQLFAHPFALVPESLGASLRWRKAYFEKSFLIG
jgi:hypothetical protein